MARTLTAGQRAAVRAAIARRGELQLTQKELAQKAKISERALQNFEACKSWPNATTLSQLERLGLDWPVGHISDLAIQHETGEPLEVNPSSLVDLAVGRVVTVLRQVPSPQREKAWREIVENVEGALFPSVSEAEAAELARRVAELDENRREEA